jgi:hypothetical protein
MADILEYPASVAGDGLTAKRQREIKRLYFASFGFITDAALDDKRLTQEDGQLIAEGVARHLRIYEGELNQDAFESWAFDIIKSAIAFYGMKRECEKRVYAAIRSVLKDCRDLGCDGDTADEIACLTWLWALENLDDLLKPGQPAKPSTRLYKAAYWYARTEKTRRLRERERFVPSDLSRMGHDEDGLLVIEPPKSRDVVSEAA